MKLNLFPKLILARDILSLGECTAALVTKFPAIAATLSPVLDDAGDLITSLSFEAGEKLLADVKAAFAASVEQYSASDAVVVAFRDAVSKLIADARK